MTDPEAPIQVTDPRVKHSEIPAPPNHLEVLPAPMELAHKEDVAADA